MEKEIVIAIKKWQQKGLSRNQVSSLNNWVTYSNTQ